MSAFGRSGFGSLSLLWKILLSTSVALTALFAVTGWIVQNHVINTTPAPIMMPRISKAPKIPQNNTLCWRSAGMRK